MTIQADQTYTDPATEPEDFGVGDDLNEEEAIGHDEVGAGVEDDQDDSESGESKGATTGPASGSNRALIRRVAAKAAEVAEADQQTLGVAVSLLGCGTGLADVTTAIMTAPRAVTAPFADLLSIAEASGAEQGIIAMTMGRPRLRAIWSLLDDLGIPGFHSSIPPSDAKAALAVAAGANTVGEETRRSIEAVKALLRKS